MNRWREGLAAKVQGTKNLHEATRTFPLDFFVMTTSLLSVCALATQAAYTAANNFQDAFARHRQSLGLPASTVSFSLVRNVGNVGSSASTIDTFKRNKTQTLSKKQFLALLEPAFLPEKRPSNVVGDPLSTATLTTCLDPASPLRKLPDGLERKSLPTWYHDGRVSIIKRALADARHQTSNDHFEDAADNGEMSNALLQLEFEKGI